MRFSSRAVQGEHFLERLRPLSDHPLYRIPEVQSFGRLFHVQNVILQRTGEFDIAGIRYIRLSRVELSS